MSEITFTAEGQGICSENMYKWLIFPGGMGLGDYGSWQGQNLWTMVSTLVSPICHFPDLSFLAFLTPVMLLQDIQHGVFFSNAQFL